MSLTKKANYICEKFIEGIYNRNVLRNNDDSYETLIHKFLDNIGYCYRRVNESIQGEARGASVLLVSYARANNERIFYTITSKTDEAYVLGVKIEGRILGEADEALNPYDVDWYMENELGIKDLSIKNQIDKIPIATHILTKSSSYYFYKVFSEKERAVFIAESKKYNTTDNAEKIVNEISQANECLDLVIKAERMSHQ